MQNIKVKYRTWYEAIIPPQKIKLEIPGWAGEPQKQSSGAKPQPWHCIPFVEGSTYGLELIYPFDTDCEVVFENNEVKFLGDFGDVGQNLWGNNKPPFSAFAPHHYGFTSSLDIQSPEGYVVRLEPHPRFFTDTTGTVPIVVPGHIQPWWCNIFFIVFKAPRPGEKHIFRKGEPYAQVLIVPDKVTYDLEKMSSFESDNRAIISNRIRSGSNKIAKTIWEDHIGNKFDDKYKQLSSLYSKSGQEGLEVKLLEACNDSPKSSKIIKNKVFINEDNHEQTIS